MNALSIILLLSILLSHLLTDIICYHKLTTFSSNHLYRIATSNNNIHSSLYSTSAIANNHNTLAGSIKSLNIRNGEDDDEEGDDEEEEEAAVQPEQQTIVSEETISLYKEGIKFPTLMNSSDVRVGIIMARWNADIINGLYKGVNESLTAAGVLPSNIFSTYVPGAFELPITAKFLAASKRVDVIICLGCLIKGDTMHFEYIAQATANGIMQVGLESYVPCIFGVLTVLNKQQAIDRSQGEHNEGVSWGKSAIEMGLARMSAMGMGKQQSTEAEKQTPFVNFNATMPVPAKKSGDDSKTSKKVFF